MEQGGTYNFDDGWSKPRLTDGACKSSSASSSVSKDHNGTSQITHPKVSGLRAKINARLEAERSKGNLQGEKSDGNFSSPENFIKQSEFNSNRLFGITLLAPGLNEEDSDGISALDKAMSVCFEVGDGLSADAKETEVGKDSWEEAAVHPLTDYAESELAVSDDGGSILPPEPYSVEAKTSLVEVKRGNLSDKEEIDTNFSLAESAAAEPKNAQVLQPYIPGRHFASERSESEQDRPELQALPASSVAKSARQTELRTRSPLSELKPYIPGSGYRRAAAESAVSKSSLGTVKTPSRLEAPDRGTGTISVYTEPVSAPDLVASASKNSVLPLPVVKGRKVLKKDETESQVELNAENSSETETEHLASLSEQLDEFCSENSSGSEGRSLLQRLKEVRPAKRKPPVMRL
ncbi:MAG: hypothetical protein ACI376_07930 [Candidatus Bruticola sp.]